MRLSREDLYEKFKTKVLPAPTITATAVDIMLDIAMMEIAKLEADVADRELWKQRAIDAEMDVAKFQRRQSEIERATEQYFTDHKKINKMQGRPSEDRKS